MDSNNNSDTTINDAQIIKRLEDRVQELKDKNKKLNDENKKLSSKVRELTEHSEINNKSLSTTSKKRKIEHKDEFSMYYSRNSLTKGELKRVEYQDKFLIINSSTSNTIKRKVDYIGAYRIRKNASSQIYSVTRLYLFISWLDQTNAYKGPPFKKCCSIELDDFETWLKQTTELESKDGELLKLTNGEWLKKYLKIEKKKYQDTAERKEFFEGLLNNALFIFMIIIDCQQLLINSNTTERKKFTRKLTMIQNFLIDHGFPHMQPFGKNECYQMNHKILKTMAFAQCAMRTNKELKEIADHIFKLRPDNAHN